MEKIEWKKLCEGYLISSHGTIKSVDRIDKFCNFLGTNIERKMRGRQLKSRDNGHGYLNVSMGRGQRDYVHRLVALTFIPNPENKRCVNHKNGIKTDNRVSNLEWASDSENQIHSKSTGLCKLGEAHPQAKLKNEDVIFIRENYHLGTKILAEKFKVGRPTICKIARGQSRKHS